MTLTKKGSAFEILDKIIEIHIPFNVLSALLFLIYAQNSLYSFILYLASTICRYWTSEIQACNLGQFSWRYTRSTESMTGIRWIKLVN